MDDYVHFIAMSFFLLVKFYAYWWRYIKDTVNDKVGRFLRHSVDLYCTNIRALIIMYITTDSRL